MPAPGVQELKLTRRPPADLHPSKQSLVQGMLRICLEDSRKADVAASKAVERRTAITKGKHPTSATTTTAAAAADLKIQLPGKSNPESGEHLQLREKAHEKVELGSKIAVGDTEEKVGYKTPVGSIKRGEEKEWEGLTWDEDEMFEADSLGAVSASLGTMEVASIREENSRASGIVPEPQDLLMRVIGIDDVGEVRKIGFTRPKRMGLPVFCSDGLSVDAVTAKTPFAV